MSVFSRRCLVAIVFALALSGQVSAQINIQVSKESERAFDDYVKAAESKMDWHPRFQQNPKNGETAIAAGGPQSTNEVKDALIHDWTAATFVPGATIEKTLAVLQSYDDYKKIYSPQVTDSKSLDHKSDKWRVYLRLNKSKGLISAVLDTEYDVEYRNLSGAAAAENARWIMLSRSNKISEIQFGKAQPAGTGLGFLWRLNAYWVIERRSGGVYLECRSISMSRDIPTGTGWMIKPMVTSLPRESLRETMTATAKAVMR